MFLSTLLQKKIIGFIQFEMFTALALKTPKNCKDIHGENLNLIVFK